MLIRKVKRNKKIIQANFSTILDNKNLRLILFGGKGGSGKTTSAAATAVHLSQMDGNKEILVVSTDPAHSLADSFDCEIGNEITPIPGVKNISAMEIDPQKLFAEFKKEHGEVIKKLAERGTYLDRDDINDFFSLSLPGLDELMAIINVADILKSAEYDLIILDTAPTGHTIRLLALPEQMAKWIQVMHVMQEKHRFIMKQLFGRYVKDDADEFLEMMATDVERVKSLLKNCQITEFVPVTIPEPMSLMETERLVNTLSGFCIFVRNIIINRLREESKCDLCSSKRREQESCLAEMKNKFARYNLIKIPLFPHEIRGINSLGKFADVLFGKISHYRTVRWIETSPEIVSTSSKMSDLLDRGLPFLVFSGKGGVGKTTLATATALKMVKHYPDRKILVFSNDPAHGLSDAFGQPIGNKITLIKGTESLYALEIDAARLFEEFKMQYRTDINEIFGEFLGDKIDMNFDRNAMSELVELSPPGLDELMALKQIIDFMEKGQFDQYILDSAATGHLLRFLEFPTLIREWLKTLFKILLKYKNVVKLTHLVRSLLDLSKQVKRIHETLMDPTRTEFVMIAIPEALGILEMARLLITLKKLKFPCHHIVMNMVIPSARCDFCTAKRKEQQAYIQKTKMQFPDYFFTEVPLFPYEKTGIDHLNNFSKKVFVRKK